MKKIIILIGLSLLIITNIFAQSSPFYLSYDWQEQPDYKVTPGENEDIISLKDKKVTEFYYENDGTLGEYFLVHHAYWLNSDDKIEEYNKVYLPFSAQSELVKNKARVITKEGKIIELDDSKIFTAEDEQTKQKYKYYAFEGLEKGSFVEYFYVVKRSPSFSGNKLSFQSAYNNYNASFDLYAPKNLVFKFKSYNGLNDVTYDSTMKVKNHWSMKQEKVELLEDESQSAYDANKQFVVYKLYYNSYNKTYDISSYGKTSERMYTFLFEEPSKGVKKKIKSLIKEIDLQSITDPTAKIKALEDHLKMNFYVVPYRSAQLNDLSSILEKKTASEAGIMKLYIAICRQLEIEAQIVLTSNRYKTRFDKKFEASNFLTDYLIYFPIVKSYISPSNISTRIGFPPPSFTNNYGLFIKEVLLGEFKTGVGKIKFIKAIDHDKSFDNINVDVKFDPEDLTTTELIIDRASGGYSSMHIQPLIHFLKEKEMKEAVEEHIKYINPDMEIENTKVYNDDSKLFGVKPFRVVASVNSDEFVEKAGNKYIFKLGALIGPQMEMYQDKQRKMPIESFYKRSYLREITLEIPEGYKVNNLSDINIDNSYSKDDKTLMLFKSSFKQDGNKLKVTVEEYYNIIEVELDIYEDYRKVINSAADFNKISLILEKN